MVTHAPVKPQARGSQRLGRAGFAGTAGAGAGGYDECSAWSLQPPPVRTNTPVHANFIGVSTPAESFIAPVTIAE